MANSASDARQSEGDIRKQLVQDRAVDVMIAVGSNFFLTVTLPCTLWFLDRGKKGTSRQDTVLFIDARGIYRQVDRALRDFTEAQIAFIANIVRLYRGEPLDWGVTSATPSGQLSFLPPTPGELEGDKASPPAGGTEGGRASLLAGEIEGGLDWNQTFPGGVYRDVPGLCKVATLTEIEAQGWSLNPGRYVGVAERTADDADFAERLHALNEELELLNAEARELEERIGENVAQLLEVTGG
jgi:type I restriction enzyme M protein